MVSQLWQRTWWNTGTCHDGVNRFLVERGDTSAAADKLEQLIDDPGLRRMLGQAGRDVVHREV